MAAKKKAAKKKAAARRRAAPKPAPPSGPPDESSPPAQPANPATRPAGKPATPPAGKRIMSVRSRRERFNRAGLRFIATIPMIVREEEIGTERFERILAEPQLRCDFT